MLTPKPLPCVSALLCVTGLLNTHLVADEGEGGCDDSIVSNQVIVELMDGVAIDEINVDYNTITLASIPAERIYLLELPGVMCEDEFELLLEGDPRFDEVELNDLSDSEGGTQDFFLQVLPSVYDDQYLWDQLSLPAVHTVSVGTGVIVAVLDTGVDGTHPLLSDNVLPGGYNFIDGNEDVSDNGTGPLAGHGTFMSGLVVSIAPQASILPVKVIGDGGVGNSFTIAQGIYYALENQASVINVSLVSSVENDVVQAALEQARSAGINVVGAAGNQNVQTVAYPAADENTLAVAATDSNDIKSVFSNFGDEVSLCAPGSDVISAVPGGIYGRWNGTSTSTAIVSGAVALIKAANPSLSVAQVESTLLTTVVDLDATNPGYENLLGAGRLDIVAALDATPVFADLDSDGIVGATDLVVLILAWGQTESPADLDADGIVGITDLILLIMNWD